MTPEEKAEFEALKREVERLSSIVNGFNDDVRFKAYIQDTVIVGEHTTDKPIIEGLNGKRYNLQTV